MNIKLLSPAGDMESLKAAIYNGANEVYVGINGFNARNNIAGFSLETLKEAVDFAHLFNVKIDLAINILFSDDELNQALKTIIKAYNLGVDAFIIQDLGLASILHTKYPEIEIHASTQMGICNLEGARYLSKFGFKRIVLARETPLGEIKRISNNLDVEIEYFAQGALCVSFSGNCYLSSYLCNASGNRGKCKQLCRLPYSLIYKNKELKKGYLLSAKDFNMLNRLKDLANAGVDVIKIEGRARRPYYVAAATKTYRHAIDGKQFSERDINLAFTRQFTEGYFNGNSKIISPYNNHIGVFVGEILKVNKGKRFNEIIFNLNTKLNSKSTFKVFKNNIEVCTFTAFSIKQEGENVYSTTTTQNVPAKGKVHLIVDEIHEEEILKQSCKVPVDLKITAVANKPIVAQITCRNVRLITQGEICDEAKNQPLTSAELNECFAKSDIFDATIESNIQNVFLTKKQLNSFRRNCFDSLYSKLIKMDRKKLQIDTIKINRYNNILTNYAIIESYSTLPKAQNIIYSPEIYCINDCKAFIARCKSENKTPILDTPNFLTQEDIILIKDIITATEITIVSNNYSTLDMSTNIIAGAGLNIYNNISAAVINKKYLTAEQDFGSKFDFPYMTLKHCPLKEHLNSTCANCQYKDGYSYKMQNGKILNLKRKKLSSCTFYLSK